MSRAADAALLPGSGQSGGETGLSATPLKVLLVVCEGAAAPELPASSSFGPFDTHALQGLEAAAAMLATQPFDVLLMACRTVDARRLVMWPGLSQSVVDAAVLVLTTDEPGADLSMLLARRGVQDVLPLHLLTGDALPRALRLAVERKGQERLARKAYATDLLTGLPNQAQLVEHANQLLALREREPGPLAMLTVRLEGLSAAEAVHGPEGVNVLRRKVAVRLRAAVRASDVVASLAADTYGVLLSKVQDPQDADHVARKLAAALQPPFAVAGNQVALACAVGVAHHPEDGKDAATLLRRASALAASAPAQGHGGFARVQEGRAAPAAANDEPAV